MNILYSGAPRVSDPSNILNMFKIARTIDAIKPDIIHYQSGVIWEGLLALLGRKYAIVTTVHDVIHHPQRKSFQFTPQVLIDLLAKRSDVIIVHGHSLKQLALTRYNMSSNEAARVQVVPHPIISRYGVGQPSSEPGRKILFFGNLDKWKGIETLLPAMELLTERMPEVSLHIAGSCGEKEYYEQLPYRYQNVTWDMRRQSDEEIRALFAAADIIALPYSEASQSGVLHVAQSFAMPVVATSVGALGESIKDGVNGLQVPPNEPAELANAMHRLLTEPALRAEIIGNMIKERDDQLLSGSVGETTLAVYRHALRQQGSHTAAQHIAP